MKQKLFYSLFLSSAIVFVGLFAFSAHTANALECSWTESEYRCTEGYWSSQYVCTWYDPPPQTYCEPSSKTETQCGWEYQCNYNEQTGNEDCGWRYECKQVQVPSEKCTTTNPPPYKSCEWDTVWVDGSCGNYPTSKTQTCPANSETSCSYATDCSLEGSKSVTTYSCGTSGCVANTTTQTCTRTFPTCTNNVGETGYVCGGSCSAPPNKTLTVSVTASPSSGKAPLKNVQITADVGGTATGTITYKLDCTNDLVFDATETSNQTSYTFTKKCDYDTAGTYTARVNVTRQTLSVNNTTSITVTPATQCAAPTNLSCSYNSSGRALTLSWGSVANVKDYFFEWAKWGSGYTFCFFPGCTADSKTVSTTSGTTSSLSTNTTYKLHVRAETSQGNACAAPGPFSQEIECYTGTCNKTSNPEVDSFRVPIETSSGVDTQKCTVSVVHTGRDYGSGGQSYDTNVSYKETSSQTATSTSKSTIAMDDDPVSGCNNNLVFTNSFNFPNTGILNAVGEVNSKDAGHDLSFGYGITASQCVITGVQGSGYTEVLPDGTYTDGAGGLLPLVSSDKKTASYQQAVYDNTSSTAQTSNFSFTLKECTQNAHCSAYPDKTYCNGGETRTITNVSALPLNTCIDSVAPSSRIRRVEDGPGKLPGFTYYPDTGVYSAFLKGDNGGETKKTWWLFVEDVDNNGGSGITSCYISVNGIVKSRLCNTWATFTVGKPSTVADCISQEDNQCKVRVWAKDMAENTPTSSIILSGISKDERSNEGTDGKEYLSRNFDEFHFGVDWTPPTAQ